MTVLDVLIVKTQRYGNISRNQRRLEHLPSAECSNDCRCRIDRRKARLPEASRELELATSISGPASQAPVLLVGRFHSSPVHCQVELALKHLLFVAGSLTGPE
ncbi:hypothetical protein XANCAGTX0491_000036 [Xanthoria calcicola]